MIPNHSRVGEEYAQWNYDSEYKFGAPLALIIKHLYIHITPLLLLLYVIGYHRSFS